MATTLTAQRSLARNLVLGFVAGAIAVLIVHQVMVLILGTVGLARNPPYSMAPVKPWGVPTLFNSMFWGGLWGAVFGAIADRLPRQWPLFVTGFLFGVLGPVLVGWFVVAPIKGLPVAAGWNPTRMLTSVLINGPFGIGVAYIFTALRDWAGKRFG
jgi:hypothetical protein